MTMLWRATQSGGPSLEGESWLGGGGVQPMWGVPVWVGGHGSEGVPARVGFRGLAGRQRHADVTPEGRPDFVALGLISVRDSYL